MNDVTIQVRVLCPPAGSDSLALAEVCVRAAGGERRRDAPRAAGGGGGGAGGGDEETSPPQPQRAQSRLPQLLLEDIHLVLEQFKLE